ncbi:RNA-directed DNA polymerase, eukaryota [Tanacetum coccineum]
MDSLMQPDPNSVVKLVPSQKVVAAARLASEKMLNKLAAACSKLAAACSNLAAACTNLAAACTNLAPTLQKLANESNKRKFERDLIRVWKIQLVVNHLCLCERDCPNAIDKESPLRLSLIDDCFDVVKISYLGELWVLLEFETAKAKDSFRGNVGVGSWFSVITTLTIEFVPDMVRLVCGGIWTVFRFVLAHFTESFKIVFRGKVYWVRASEVLGWTPEFSEEEEEDELSVEDNNDGRINDLEANNDIDESDVEEVLETLFDQPDDQKDKHSEDPFGLYPLLNKENIELARKVTEEDHSLSHPSGFTPEEGLNEGNTVNLDMKDYGENERDDNSFVNLEDGKDNSESVNKNSESKRSKYSVLPRKGGSILNLMEEVVKDYLAHVSNQWVGKLVMMGDFNEVRYKSDRYGSNFNAHDAEIFNSFIYNAGLDEVLLGGSAYTWCLKSASKMSKLDRFFVSENLLSMCPNITAITLERFISDHRPILLREVRYDYGPIPFRFYRYWLEVDGFDKLVRDSWNVAPITT